MRKRVLLIAMLLGTLLFTGCLSGEMLFMLNVSTLEDAAATGYEGRN